VPATSYLSSRSRPAARNVRLCCMGTDNESSQRLFGMISYDGNICRPHLPFMFLWMYEVCWQISGFTKRLYLWEYETY